MAVWICSILFCQNPFFFESIAFGCLPHKVASLWREEEELRNMIGQQLLLAADDGRLETILTDNMKVSGDGSKGMG